MSDSFGTASENYSSALFAEQNLILRNIGMAFSCGDMKEAKRLNKLLKLNVSLGELVGKQYWRNLRGEHLLDTDGEQVSCHSK